jgi:hypothetical protein
MSPYITFFKEIQNQNETLEKLNESMAFYFVNETAFLH